jgi:glycyl-tRNA synthetase beta subunit
LPPKHARPQALEGFCKKNGASPGDVTVEADPKGVEYCWVTVQDGGRSAAEVRQQDSRSLLGVAHPGHDEWTCLMNACVLSPVVCRSSIVGRRVY